MLNISWTEVVKKTKRCLPSKYFKSMYTVFIELPLRCCNNECHGKVFVHTIFDVNTNYSEEWMVLAQAV